MRISLNVWPEELTATLFLRVVWTCSAVGDDVLNRLSFNVTNFVVIFVVVTTFFLSKVEVRVWVGTSNSVRLMNPGQEFLYIPGIRD